MQKHNLSTLIEFDEERFLPRTILNQPGFRPVLLNLRSGQRVPEHSTGDRVGVYAISGPITFYENQSPTAPLTGSETSPAAPSTTVLGIRPA